MERVDDEDMVRHLWNGLFPTLPYEGRVSSRWRDVGFQNDDPASDLRSSGRLALKMMLFFADHLNDEFKAGRWVVFARGRACAD